MADQTVKMARNWISFDGEAWEFFPFTEGATFLLVPPTLAPI